MFFKYFKAGAIASTLLFNTVIVSAQENTNATAKQVVEKFQADLISVMKNGKQLGYAGRDY